ncbi:SH3 domain-containing protein [Amphritea sp. HPY]|uniref:SH3 domain-containing protein n=1 Tax=Amphritea sp. HPY TaxID=3421652 RepID=UPI003D7F1472
MLLNSKFLNTTPSPNKTAQYLLLLLAVLSGSAAAADRLEVEIRPSVLNVRQTTSTTSPVVEVLQQGERLTVTTTGLQDWIKLDDKRGFISIHYVNVLSRTPVLQSPAEQSFDQSSSKPATTVTPEAETSEPEVPEVPITIKNTDTPALCSANHNNTRIELIGQSKTCRKNLQTMGYESCDILLNFFLNSECTTPSRVNVQCTANIVSQGTGPVQTQAELGIQKLISITESGASTLRLSWAPKDPDSPVTQVQLSDGECGLIVR